MANLIANLPTTRTAVDLVLLDRTLLSDPAPAPAKGNNRASEASLNNPVDDELGLKVGVTVIPTPSRLRVESIISTGAYVTDADDIVIARMPFGARAGTWLDMPNSRGLFNKAQALDLLCMAFSVAFNGLTSGDPTLDIVGSWGQQIPRIK